MVFFAALTFVGFQEVLPGWLGLEAGAPVFWLAFYWPSSAMMVLGIATERIVLRPLVNQPHITLFMATIGLTYLVEGWPRWSGANAQAGSGHRRRADRLADGHYEIGVSKFDLRRRGGYGLAGGLLASCSSTPRSAGPAGGGRRPPGGAVHRHPAADDLARGGGRWRAFVALVAGMIWGARNGVQFVLTFTPPKAVLIPAASPGARAPSSAADHRRLLEKLAEVYVGPMVGGGIEGWFPYTLALALLVRPRGCLARSTSTACDREGDESIHARGPAGGASAAAHGMNSRHDDRVCEPRLMA